MKTVRQQLEDLTPGEAVYGFAAWLTSRDQKTVLSSSDDAAPVANLVSQFVAANKLPGPKENWPEDLVIPMESKTIREQFEAVASYRGKKEKYSLWVWKDGEILAKDVYGSDEEDTHKYLFPEFDASKYWRGWYNPEFGTVKVVPLTSWKGDTYDMLQALMSYYNVSLDSILSADPDFWEPPTELECTDTRR